jgi:predicted transcriptional regulator
MAGERVERFVMGAPGILQQLKVLRKAGLVSSLVQSQSRIQALNPAVLDKLEVRMKRTHSLWSRRLDALELELNAKDEREAESKKEKQ